MLSVSQAMSLIKKPLLDLLMARDTGKGQELMNCLTQTPTRIMTLLNQTGTRGFKKGEQSNPTWELKDDLLNTIANDLNADE